MNLDLGDTRLIIDKCKERGVLRNQCAYLLATTKHETAPTMKPIAEYGGDAYFHRMYDIQGKRPRVAKVLGNTRPGDGVKFKGRGYTMTTGRTNYAKQGRSTGVDLLSNPDRAMETDIAIVGLIDGAMEGWWTGKKLSKYVTLQKSDFYNARRVINGTDKAAEIAAMAKEYDEDLKAEGYGTADLKPIPVPTAKPRTSKPAMQSRTVGGGTAAGAGGVAVLVEPVKQAIDVIKGQKEALSSGDTIQLVIGAIIVGGALLALYARLDDGGYLDNMPWRRK